MATHIEFSKLNPQKPEDVQTLLNHVMALQAEVEAIKANLEARQAKMFERTNEVQFLEGIDLPNYDKSNI